MTYIVQNDMWKCNCKPPLVTVSDLSRKEYDNYPLESRNFDRRDYYKDILEHLTSAAVDGFVIPYYIVA